MDNALIQSVHRQIQAARRILVVSHIRPDGDAVGSLLAMGLALQAIGKDMQMVLADGVPKNFRRLKGSDKVLNQPQGDFDFISVVDCSDLERAGSALNGYSAPDLNIDHHPTNLNFARINLVESNAVATAEMLFDYLPQFGLPITIPVAEALLTGLITDTIGFRTVNMTPKALRVAADLMETGVDLPTLYQKALLSRSLNAVRYWGTGLSKINADRRMVWTTLSIADRQKIGYPGRDDADLINVLSTIEDTDIVLIFIEQANERVKVSWRSKPGLDVSQIAVNFGGGGHKTAAGAEIEGSLEDVESKVIQATKSLITKNIS
ncbi:MAG: bifunctional oligoribonuclease/PAP phosphatase NrnA [Anaerolineales bacterium]|nr:bifunctional oligoribonuclease/PAP phosphatase NrnA [Anaerolineales bacterium]